jgi:hypothetical protein|nr:DUF3341 domain-containing protein [Kofleriaceae bacterium]
MRRGVIAELPDEAALLRAVTGLRARGLSKLEAYTPCLIDGLDDALGHRRSNLAAATAVGAVCGAAGGYGLEWLLNGYLYPVQSGGRPPHMPLAFVPIGIEMGFLFGALATVIAVLVVGKLVKLWEPVCEVPGFGSATRAGMWIAVAADDARFDEAVIAEVLERSGGGALERFGDEP